METLISPGTRQIVQVAGHPKQPTVTSDVLLYVQRVVESNFITIKPRVIGSSEINGKKKLLSNYLFYFIIIQFYACINSD